MERPAEPSASGWTNSAAAPPPPPPAADTTGWEETAAAAAPASAPADDDDDGDDGGTSAEVEALTQPFVGSADGAAQPLAPARWEPLEEEEEREARLGALGSESQGWAHAEEDEEDEDEDEEAAPAVGAPAADETFARLMRFVGRHPVAAATVGALLDPSRKRPCPDSDASPLRRRAGGAHALDCAGGPATFHFVYAPRHGGRCLRIACARCRAPLAHVPLYSVLEVNGVLGLLVGVIADGRARDGRNALSALHLQGVERSLPLGAKDAPLPLADAGAGAGPRTCSCACAGCSS
jgi:hypothetical protein